MSEPKIVIVGAGPAGMILAYQLASNGVSVRVLEQHPDFERELRGELIGPSVLPALEQLGLMRRLVDRGLARTDVERRMFVGATRNVQLPGGAERGALISQPGLLALLHEAASATGRYTIDFSTVAQRVVVENGRALAVEARRGGKEERVDADLVVVCNGRGTKLRKSAGMETELAEKPDDTLWLRFDLADAKDALPKDTLVHMFGGGVVVVLFQTSRARLQIAYSAPGDLGALKTDVPALRAELLPRLNEPLRTIVDRKLAAPLDAQILKVSIDRLTKWSAPGLLFLGDAAHTMGPAGAQGLNLAIRDAFVASDHLLDAKGRYDAAVLEAIEAERRPEIEGAQAGQLRAYGMVQKPLVVQHLMFTMLGLVMSLKKMERPAAGVIVPRHLVPIA
jgi:2-polyprenyl-6-methoxyphenol hydroxylase-like FAD-dependent oxidoreductase